MEKEIITGTEIDEIREELDKKEKMEKENNKMWKDAAADALGMINEPMEKETTPEEIAKIIDPDNTFIQECEKIVKMEKETMNEKAKKYGLDWEKPKEFRLDEKRIKMYSGIQFREFVYPEEKVKEFIRLKEDLVTDLINEKITWNEYIDKSRKLAGKGLLK